MNQSQETPIQEAASIVTIGAILLAVGCYAAAASGLPVASPALFWVASLVYHWVPALSAMTNPQLPYVVASGVVGGLAWVFGMGLAPLIARALSAGHLSSLERQTQKLKRNRAKIAKTRRDRDSFDVS